MDPALEYTHASFDGVGSAGALLGTLLVPRATAALGIGRAVIVGQLLVGGAALLIPAALLRPALALPLLIAAELIQSCAGTVYGIVRASLFQVATPERLLGRVSASTTALGLLPAVVGTLAGGALGDRLRISATVLVGAAGSVFGVCWLLESPLRELRALPGAPVGARSKGDPCAPCYAGLDLYRR